MQSQKCINIHQDTVNYGMVKENASYTGYDLDGGAEVERSVGNRINSVIRDMAANGEAAAFVEGDAQGYRVEKQ